MKPVGNQRGGSDAAADPDPVAGNEFIAREADDACSSHHGHELNVPKVEEAALVRPTGVLDARPSNLTRLVFTDD